jgi:hypothetical protein
MSVVSLARAAGVIFDRSKSRSLIVSNSFVLPILRQRTPLPRDRIDPGRREAGRHVGILGVGEDERLRPRRVGVDIGDFLIE